MRMRTRHSFWQHMNVSVPADGKFYRVHACNSAGCSNWTGTEHALYDTRCP